MGGRWQGGMVRHGQVAGWHGQAWSGGRGGSLEDVWVSLAPRRAPRGSVLDTAFQLCTRLSLGSFHLPCPHSQAAIDKAHIGSGGCRSG